jgi:hypothetical protein
MKFKELLLREDGFAYIVTTVLCRFRAVPCLYFSVSGRWGILDRECHWQLGAGHLKGRF